MDVQGFVDSTLVSVSKDNCGWILYHGYDGFDYFDPDTILELTRSDIKDISNRISDEIKKLQECLEYIKTL